MPINPDSVSHLLERVRTELCASFVAGQPIYSGVGREIIDVIGGFSEKNGATVWSTLSDRAASVLIQPRSDAMLQIFSFDLFDQHRPFTLCAPLSAVCQGDAELLRKYFAQTGTEWASLAIGVYRALLNVVGFDRRGFNLALQTNSSDPVAQAVGFVRAFHSACGEPEWDIVQIVERALADTTSHRPTRREIAATVHAGQDQLVGYSVQSAEPEEPIQISPDVGFRLHDVEVNHDAWEKQYSCIDVAAAMGQRLILSKMKQMGLAACRELIADPMRGYLCNLALDDYRRFFRSFLPESIKGGQFLLEHHGFEDPALRVRPDVLYPVQAASDFHIFGANRARNFAESLRAAGMAKDQHERLKELNKAGHLLYATQKSLTTDAALDNGAAEVWIDKIRQRERLGYYGAGPTRRGIVIFSDADAPDFDPDASF